MPKATAAKKTQATTRAPANKTVQSPNKVATKAAQAAARQGRPATEESPTGRLNVDTRPEGMRSGRYPTQVPARRPEALPTAATAALPAFMRSDADVGKENISSQDIEIPRLKLMQGLSPELQDYDGLRAGYFFHPAAEYIFDGPFRAVPIYTDQRYILWRPRGSGSGILARADDGVHWSPSSGEFTVQLDKKDGGDTVTWKLAPTVQQSGLANWGTMNPKDSNSPPAATLMYNYLLAFPDEPDMMPAVLSFQRSSIKQGRRFNTKLKTVRAPLFGTVWEFSSKVDTNSRGEDFYMPEVKSAGLVENEAMYNMYRSMYETYSSRGLSIKDIEGMQGDEDTAVGGQPNPNAPRY